MIRKTSQKKPTRSNGSHDGDTLLHVWIPTHVYDWIAEKAKADDRTLSSYVRRVLGGVKDNPDLLKKVGV